MNLIKFLTQLWGSQRKSERELFQVLDDIEIVADTTKFDSHQMAFQWLSDLLLYEDFPTYCFGGTLFYYTIEATAERPLYTPGQAHF